MNLPSLIPSSEENTHKEDLIVDASLANYFASFPPENHVRKVLEHSFVINRPMSGVGGDGYWLYTKGEDIYVVIFDCTGHGRLASIMTRVYLNALNASIAEEKHDGNPSTLLASIHQKIKEEFKEKKEIISSGADVGIFKYQAAKQKAVFAGAGMGLAYVQNGEVCRLKGNKRRVGDLFDIARKFEQDHVEFDKKKSVSFYLFTDGLTDLIGGPKNKRLGFKNVVPLLEKAHKLPPEQARASLDLFIQGWLGSESPMDDLLILGFTI